MRQYLYCCRVVPNRGVVLNRRGIWSAAGFVSNVVGAALDLVEPNGNGFVVSPPRCEHLLAAALADGVGGLWTAGARGRSRNRAKRSRQNMERMVCALDGGGMNKKPRASRSSPTSCVIPRHLFLSTPRRVLTAD